MESPTSDPTRLEGADPSNNLAVFDRLMTVSVDAGEDVDRLAQAFCVISAETFGGMCTIALLNQHNEMLHIAGLYDADPRAMALVQEMVAATADLPRDEGVAAHVIRTGEPLLVQSISAEQEQSIQMPAMAKYIHEVGVQSLMAIPLKGPNGIYGEVSVTRHRGATAFNNDDLALLSEMGQRISAAIGNGLLVRSLRRQLAAAAQRGDRAEQANATQTDRAAGVRLVFDRIMRAVQAHGDDADRLAQEFSVIAAETIGDQCIITLINPHNEMLHFAGIHDVDPGARALLKDLSATTSFMPRQQSVALEAIRDGRPVLRKTISEEEAREFVMPEYLPFLEAIGLESSMSVPLKGRGRNIGVIGLNRHKGGRPYDEGELGLLIEMALRMQVALENTLLIESLQHQVTEASPADRTMALDLHDTDRLALLHRLTHMIGENRDKLERMMELAAVMTAEALGGVCQITLLNRHNERMHIAAYYDTDPRARELIGELIRATADMPRDAGLVGRVIQSGQPLLVPNVDEQQLKLQALPELVRFVDEIGVSGILAVPLTGASGPLGAISVSRHRGEPDPDEADLSLLNEIAFRLAIAVENRQLIETLRREMAAALTTQQALNVSEERFRSVFESTTLGIELMDPGGTLIDTNRAFEHMTGFSKLELIGRPFGRLQHPEDAVPVLQLLTEIRMNRQASAPFENRILRKDGSTLWVKTNFAAIKRTGGDEGLELIAAVHEDVTARKQTERYFQGVLEATPDALVMVDAQGKILLVNRQMEAMFGYKRFEILGQSVDQLLPERLRAKHPLHRAGYQLDPHVRPMGERLELFAMRKDGSEFSVEISLSPLQVDATPVVVAAIRDITERKQREAALIRSERTLAEAQRVARLGSLDYDMTNQTVEASDEALRIFGIPREQFRGTDTLRAHMHPDDEQRVVEGTYAAVENHSAAELEFRVVHPDGTIRIVHDRVVGMYDEEGKPVRMLGTVQDVTEQREAEREVTELRNHLQSSVELERLRLAQELHDGPMQDLYGSSYRLDELLDAVDGETRAALEEVNGEIEQTISELRAIAKELRPPALSNFGLEKAIRSYVEDFQDKHPNISLHLSLAQDRQLLPETMRLTLFRVFQQALANVLRHSQASDVRVRFSLDAEEARLEVSDNGSGFTVPPSWMGFVRQGHFGLAGAAERVHALGGILMVESQPKQSTTVTAVIPWTPDPGGEDF